MAQEIICLGCPNGCHLECTAKNDGTVEVTGNQCERGLDYGREELLEPKRVVTAVVRTTAPSLPYAPVRTNAPLVKAQIPALLQELYALEVSGPAPAGQELLHDFAGTGVHVVLTRTVPAG